MNWMLVLLASLVLVRSSWALENSPAYMTRFGEYSAERGFSISRPDGDEWVFQGASNEVITFVRWGTSPNNTFVAFAKAIATSSPLHSNSDLVSWYQQLSEPYEKVARYKNVRRQDLAIDSPQQSQCMAWHVTLDDYGAHQAQKTATSFLAGEILDVFCIHPADDHSVVWVQVSERGGDSIPSPYLEQQARHLIGSLKYYKFRTPEQFRELAEQGDVNAQLWTARNYLSGRLGFLNREATAREWYGKAASKNNPEALFRLAITSLRDRGGNIEEAFKSLHKASELGYWLAEGTFGTTLLGDGPHKNIAEGIRWIRKGAEDGDWVAQNILALLLWKGEYGLSQDKAEAIRWFRKSAASGLDDSQVMLGALYIDGDGLPRDLGLARRWLSLAAQQGHAGAKKLLERLDGR